MPPRKSTHKILDKKPELDPYELSSLSTTAVQPTRWASCDFVLAAGLCILQPATGRVVLVTTGDHKAKGGRWFLPRGRKDIGESLEETALREGHEVCSPCPPMSQKENSVVAIMVGERVSSTVPAYSSISPSAAQTRTRGKDRKQQQVWGS
jgi:hypothetical protein